MTVRFIALAKLKHRDAVIALKDDEGFYLFWDSREEVVAHIRGGGLDRDPNVAEIMTACIGDDSEGFEPYDLKLISH